MRMRKKANLIPRMEACGSLWIRQPAEHKGNWRTLKPDAERIRLELGCGKGRFTAETAKAHPEDLYIALERVPDAMVIAMERCRELGLSNVFFIDGDAAELPEYFAPDEVDLIYVNFCDPWPPARQAHRRLTHEGFLRIYRQVLKDGGELHFKTDNRNLFEWSLFQFPKAGFALSQVTHNLHEHGVQGIMTDYEEKFHALGTPIHRCVATKGDLPDRPLLETLAQLLPRWTIRPVAEEEIPAVLAMFRRNRDYFDLDGKQPTAQSIREDMAALPPRAKPEGKHYLALWREGQVEAVLDLVEGFPRERTVWIGLLLVDAQKRRQGIGGAIAAAVAQAATLAGMDTVRLACLQNNPVGHAFWEASGFRDIREGETAGEAPRPVWIMERTEARRVKGTEGAIRLEEIPAARTGEFWELHYRYLTEDGIVTDPEDMEYFAGEEYRGTLRAHMERERDRHHMVYFLREGTRVGAAQYTTYQSEDGKCFLLDFWVFPAFRGEGMGHRCFGALEDHTKADGAVYYRINCERENALRFWRSLGFRDAGRDEYGMKVLEKRP